MKIYVTHSRNFDYRNGLYVPIRSSILNQDHEFVLPHEESEEPFDSRDLILKGSLDLLIAEVSLKSTAQGIEIGWADFLDIPVAFLYKLGSNPSNALKKVSNIFVPYSSDSELIKGIGEIIGRVRN